ncbi:hypothetical protein [Micromonospora aurantiaca (nom. illeg.)]|uniref:hypothetical protein n=1 Tax=Micromonospora aurantiaca (nom. illeg.) TaxID=47850 RepID=UPI0033C282CD
MDRTAEKEELERLARLHLSAARAALEHWRAAGGIEVESSAIRKFNAAYPVVAHAMAQVAAALTLHDQGLVYAARVNARVALEHALAAQWVVQTVSGEDEIIGSMNRIHRNIVRDLNQGGNAIPPQLQGDLQRPPGEPQFDLPAVAREFDGGTQSIYPLFRELAGAVHVSLATLTSYLHWRGEHKVPALRPSGATDLDSEQILALGWSALLAVSAIERLRKGQPHLAMIHQLGRDHELVPDLQPAGSTPTVGGP